MQTNILKKIFVKLIKAFGFEIIDQNQFKSPTLNKELNEQLSNLNKSIVLPLGEVKLKRKMTGDKLLIKMLDIDPRKRIGLQTIINNI